MSINMTDTDFIKHKEHILRMRNLRPRREVILFAKIIYEFLMQQTTVSYTSSPKKIKLVINNRNLIERYLQICHQLQIMLFLLFS